MEAGVPEQFADGDLAAVASAEPDARHAASGDYDGPGSALTITATATVRLFLRLVADGGAAGVVQVELRDGGDQALLQQPGPAQAPHGQVARRAGERLGQEPGAGLLVRQGADRGGDGLALVLVAVEQPRGLRAVHRRGQL